MPKVTKKDALLYHSRGRHGKIEVIPTKPYSIQFDLSMAYTPGIGCVAPAVAKAAMESGVAKYPITDWEAYRKSLDRRLSDHLKKIAECSGI